MPQTPSLHSTHPFHPVSPVIIEPSMEEEVPRPTCIQMDSIPPTSFSSSCYEEPFTEERLLGPFRRLLIVTGLDCSVVAHAQNNPSLVRRALITKIFAIFIIVVIFFRCGMLFNQSGRAMSFGWAESNMFAFMGIHAIVCALCIFGWTKNAFLPGHLERLEAVRLLRLVKNPVLDDYTGLHKKAWIWAGLWIAAVMSHCVVSTLAHKVILGGPKANTALLIFMPIANLLASIVVTLLVIIWFFANLSLAREIEYFNKELEDAVADRRMHNLEFSLKFSHRQAELLRLVRRANESLGSYASSAPIFCFYGLINAVYLASFQDSLPTPVFTILLFNLFALIAMTVFTLRPTSNVQYHITDTSRILMSCEEFEKMKGSSELFHNYHTMIDRSLKTDTRIRVAGGIPIYRTTMNVAMFLLPNLGNILSLIKKALEGQGVHL